MTSGGLHVNGHHYELEISGQGEALLLLHGFGGDKSIWAELRAGLDSAYRIIAVDILGHGASDKPTGVGAYQMARVSRDILSLLDELRIPDCHLLGYSMGGRLALYLSAGYPGRCRSLILESASPGLADKSERERRRRQDHALAERIETMGVAWFVDYWEKLPLWKSQQQLPEEIRRAQRKQRLGNDATGLANSLRGMGSGAQPEIWTRLGQVSTPALLLAGARDSKFVAINQRMARQLPRADLQVIPDAGHNIHLEQPQIFIKRVKSFLQGL
ncbi:MAG: 2-succinyl-6-hydroxy-2,4-cyclohexadiene-1-carboxylate synthase [Chloroflexota bacterium]|nr:2-succinyl-6-hydroxy-2,4-cyclohexadiene-1-carboxylate synthase [Chloroflexota bacterium]MDE2952738.1 2-succinyl-6-hydroxy-2,4-cyclohexadiene-1-carboxylate synthase [Chloroflexota bacterium]